jgi:hypothetical protein
MSDSLYVEISNPTSYDYSAPEQFGDWESRSTYEGCRVFVGNYSDGPANYRSSIKVDFEVTPGMVVYPVLVIYGTGNSFGNSSGNVHLVDVFDDIGKARGLKAAIKESAQTSQYEFIYKDKEYYAGYWTGYFERLEDVIVETEVVRA